MSVLLITHDVTVNISLTWSKLGRFDEELDICGNCWLIQRLASVSLVIIFGDEGRLDVGREEEGVEFIEVEAGLEVAELLFMVLRSLIFLS